MRELGIGVAGDYMSMYVATGEGEQPALAEHLGNNRYVAYTGSSNGTLNRANLATIDLAFNGWIDHMTLRQPWQNPLGSVIDLISRERCESQEHRLRLTRR